MNENTLDIIKYRKQRSHEALEEAKILLDASHCNAAVNRLYYACFYAVSALLLSMKFSSSKHTGVRSLFNRHVVKAGLMDKDMAGVYNILFDKRQESDYDDFVIINEAEVVTWLEEADEFIKQVDCLTDIGE